MSDTFLYFIVVRVFYSITENVYHCARNNACEVVFENIRWQQILQINEIGAIDFVNKFLTRKLHNAN